MGWVKITLISASVVRSGDSIDLSKVNHCITGRLPAGRCPVIEKNCGKGNSFA